jgi:hypothetical protein
MEEPLYSKSHCTQNLIVPRVSGEDKSFMENAGLWQKASKSRILINHEQ